MSKTNSSKQNLVEVSSKHLLETIEYAILQVETSCGDIVVIDNEEQLAILKSLHDSIDAAREKDTLTIVSK